MSPSRRLVLASSLIAVTGGAAVAGKLWPKPRPPAVASPDDDLAWLAAFDAGAAQAPAYDVLVAGKDGPLLARASDSAIVSLSKTGAGERTVVQLDAIVRAMALCDDVLWIVTAGPARSMQSNSLLRVPVSGGAPTVVAKLAAPRDVACDGRWVFAVDEDAAPSLARATTIRRFAVAGGDSKVLARSESAIADVALDADDVLWADGLEGTIVAAPKAGGPPRVIVDQRGLPGAVAVRDGSIFWVEARSESLWTAPLSGGTPRQLARDFAGFARIVVTPDDVFWANEDAVDGGYRLLAVPRSGGETTAMTKPVPAIDSIATDGSRVYWASAGKVSALAADVRTR